MTRGMLRRPACADVCVCMGLMYIDRGLLHMAQQIHTTHSTDVSIAIGLGVPYVKLECCCGSCWVSSSLLLGVHLIIQLPLARKSSYASISGAERPFMRSKHTWVVLIRNMVAPTAFSLVHSVSYAAGRLRTHSRSLAPLRFMVCQYEGWAKMLWQLTPNSDHYTFRHYMFSKGLVARAPFVWWVIRER